MATIWTIDPTHSEIGFRVKHLMISTVKGQFRRFSATATTEGDAWENASLQFEAEVDSIETGVEQRDGHLKSEDFFHASAFPTLRFVSTAFHAKSEDTYEMTGNLTIRDVTLPLTLKATYGGTMTDFYGQTKAGFEVSGNISRKAFDLKWDAVTEAGGIVVSDDVKLVLDVQMTKQVA
ncbi:MAG: polyisoprenoid-binding protein [Bacteroidetes Order II. Incertae sedis bacterium]|nr:polyisoprenoid-binding protein [Bacteroidetes Order II. bacterium]